MKRTLFAVMALLAGRRGAGGRVQQRQYPNRNESVRGRAVSGGRQKLNDTWQQALQRAVGKQQTLLKQAQQAWIALRDADCAFLASGAEGGSMQPMLVSQCMTDKSVERESFLASLLRCEDGDQSCPAAAGQLTDANAFDNHPLDIIDRLFKKAASCSVAPVTASTWVAKSA